MLKKATPSTRGVLQMSFVNAMQGENVDRVAVSKKYRSFRALQQRVVYLAKKSSGPNIGEVVYSIKSGNYDAGPFNRNRLLPPFVRYYEMFEVSPRYRMSVCMIPKVMSSLALGIFCYLKSPLLFKASGRKISTEKWHWSFCKERNVLHNYTHAEPFLGSVRLAFIRHPIDRFLSGFVNKCILKGPYEHLDYCFGCGTDLGCFVYALKKELWLIYERDGNHESAIGSHLAPLTWYCNFKEHLSDYIYLRHGKSNADVRIMADQLDEILQNVGLSQSARHDIRKAVLVGKSPHSTSTSSQREKAERELFANKTLLKNVIEFYYFDFMIFDYEIPSL